MNDARISPDHQVRRSNPARGPSTPRVLENREAILGLGECPKKSEDSAMASGRPVQGTIASTELRY